MLFYCLHDFTVHAYSKATQTKKKKKTATAILWMGALSGSKIKGAHKEKDLIQR